MRLSKEAIQVIKEETAREFGEQAQVYLFGSRVDDSKKGGDIDLLIVPSSTEHNSQEVYKKNIQTRAGLKAKLGDQKIDLIVAEVDDQRPVVINALNEGVKL